MSPAVGIHAILEAAALIGGSSGWTGKIGHFPETDNVIAVMDGPGRTPEVVVATDYPTIQILLRGDKSPTSYATSYAQAEAIFLALQALPTLPPPTEYPELTSILARTSIAPMGRDDSNRPLFSMNFNLITTPVNAGYRM